MKDILFYLLLIPGIIGALMANVYYFTIIGILNKNDFKASYINLRFGDLGNFTHLINKTTGSEKKLKYKKIMFRFRISITTMALGFLLVVLWVMIESGAGLELINSFLD